ncbi:hypothetical protein I6E68_03190 [Salinibacterium sp. NSLL150]|uniref:Mu transposase domain-containing protein n=1 Tax=unclassified Salinibacterium TaxID=2632331 RepID=UPI0018CEFD8E|nr:MULTISPECIES: hypothetical protein [unclassified Salinibacterium]MBH0098140.1 hypothetical protein [Salinibacterium sp. NSLL35]MBH0100895.1 hypothetical protein [Salinibacterium sp. NSLL150]MBH0103654.1 hypothetical protein [Salinibacterium sp. NSLL16]MBH0106415.1 hypothetical protein [Salinibacterium sp. NSLL17]
MNLDPLESFVSSRACGYPPEQSGTSIGSADAREVKSDIGRLVDVTASLDTVNVTHDGVNVTSHERERARALTVTGPEPMRHRRKYE